MAPATRPPKRAPSVVAEVMNSYITMQWRMPNEPSDIESAPSKGTDLLSIREGSWPQIAPNRYERARDDAGVIT